MADKEKAMSGSREELDPHFSEKRGQWSNQIEFLLTCVGYVVGLGNIYRFPYMCYAYGGGAFLVAYFVINFTLALGLVLMEMTPAQYSGRGPQSVWVCVPILRGCGFAAIVIMLLIAVPFCSIYTWAWYYLFASFTSVLPWATCANDFNSPYCYSKSEAIPCEERNGTFWNQTCYTALQAEELGINNMTSLRTSAALEFFLQKLYRVDYEKTIDHLGTIKWDLALTSLFSWLLTFLCVIKGISSIGKVVYFSATFPYIIIAVMIGRGATLEGSMDGINFYLTADWQRLLQFDTWAAAASQVLFSVAVGFGGMLTFSSYSKFKNNLVRDAFFVVSVNGLTSFYAGFAVFSILGFMAHDLGVKVEDVVQIDFLLAFVTYPEVVTRIPAAPLWSVLFFFMLVVVALDSVITGVEVLMTGVMDMFPKLRRVKSWVALAMCIFLFFFTLLECTEGGVFFVILLDYYTGVFAIIITCIFECIALAYIYGPIRLSRDISVMVDNAYWWKYLRIYFILLWVIVCPAILLAVLVYWCLTWIPMTFGTGLGDPPRWAIVVGWMSGMSTLLTFPIGALYSLYKTYGDSDYSGDCMQRFVKLFSPAKVWGPRRDEQIDDIAKASFDNPAFTISNTKL